ncbi:MAG: NAD(+)/NADH kinase [Clostridia bacterium]|nr:NAD(+)/NADH kinase [Clostridia bacterium]
MKNIFIYTNKSEASESCARDLAEKLKAENFTVQSEFSDSTEFVCVVGGDGTLMHAMRDCGYPATPFVGINTGHLGFYQEFHPQDLDELVGIIISGDYNVQSHRLLTADVKLAGGDVRSYQALTDVVFRGSMSKVTHLRLAIGDSFIENFSGDGIIVASSAGSTAYNYSLGGSIVDPRVSLLQITPIAPMNNKTFRSFTSSLLVPPGLDVHIYPEAGFTKSGYLIVDGEEYFFEDVEDVAIDLSEQTVNIVRLAGYDFWAKVKSKFL